MSASTGNNSSRAADLGLSLDLEHVEVGLYRGHPRRPSLPRTFGGEVVAQALRAAGDTVPAERPVHSLHAYFIRPGDSRGPVLYRVEDTRDGGSFTTRRVAAQQDGKSILTMQASFHRIEASVGHQLPVADAPPPESLPAPEAEFASMDDETRSWFGALSARFPVRFRFVDPPPRVMARNGQQARPRFRFWFRTRHALPPDPLSHACAVAYVSDLLLLSTAAAQHGFVLGEPGIQMASLDHAVWFHGSFHADDWLLYEQESHWTGRSRALCRGTLFDRSGRLVATVAQEGLLRLAQS